MSRRKTVKLNIEFTAKKIKEKFRHNVIFCELMGRSKQKTWVSDWQRTPPKNLPSPEEAAKMCRLLDTTPEEILTDKDDIQLVRGILDTQKEEPDAIIDDGLNELEREFVKILRSCTDDEQLRLLELARVFAASSLPPKSDM